MGVHVPFKVAVGRQVTLLLLTRTLVSKHEVPAVLALWVQEDNLIETLLSLWVWWCPRHAAYPQYSDHHGTQPWAIHSVSLLLFSHLGCFSQTWATCLRISFMAYFSLHWNQLQHKSAWKYGRTPECGEQYTCEINRLAGIVILH